MSGDRAVFVDRDGVINELRYVGEEGRIETPTTPRQFRLLPGVGRGISALQRAGFQVIIISNQPGIAKGQFTQRVFERIQARQAQLLLRAGVRLDGAYYCLHHPAAVKRVYRKRCACRKPKPGLLLKAATERRLDLSGSFMVGDGLVDVQAGQHAGCRTILVGHVSSLLTRLMQRKQLFPACVAENFQEAVEHILANVSA